MRCHLDFDTSSTTVLQCRSKYSVGPENAPKYALQDPKHETLTDELSQTHLPLRIGTPLPIPQTPNPRASTLAPSALDLAPKSKYWIYPWFQSHRPTLSQILAPQRSAWSPKSKSWIRCWFQSWQTVYINTIVMNWFVLLSSSPKCTTTWQSVLGNVVLGIHVRKSQVTDWKNAAKF